MIAQVEPGRRESEEQDALMDLVLIAEMATLPFNLKYT